MAKRSRAQTLPLLQQAEKLIKEQGYSDSKAAKEVGLSQGTVSRYMRDQKGEAKKAAKKVAKKAMTISEVTPMSLGMGNSKTIFVITEDPAVVAKMLEVIL